MNDIYDVCDKCGHVETKPEIDDRPAKCENCGNTALWRYEKLHAAERHSQNILDRVRA